MPAKARAAANWFPVVIIFIFADVITARLLTLELLHRHGAITPYEADQLARQPKMNERTTTRTVLSLLRI
jgi:hypothetical protein